MLVCQVTAACSTLGAERFRNVNKWGYSAIVNVCDWVGCVLYVKIGMPATLPLHSQLFMQDGELCLNLNFGMSAILAPHSHFSLEMVSCAYM